MRFTKQLYKLIKVTFPLVVIALLISLFTWELWNYKTIGLITFASSILEIYGVLLIFCSELYASSYMKKWANPKLTSFDFPFTCTKKFIEKNGFKHSYYIGFGKFVFFIIHNAENLLNICGSIKSSWYWLWNKPNSENCKISADISATLTGTEKHTQIQIDDLKKYSKVKIFGFALLFFAYFVQLMYILLTTKIWHET